MSEEADLPNSVKRLVDTS